MVGIVLCVLSVIYFFLFFLPTKEQARVAERRFDKIELCKKDVNKHYTELITNLGLPPNNVQSAKEWATAIDNLTNSEKVGYLDCENKYKSIE